MPYITVEAHVDLDDFDDEDIRGEYEARGLGNSCPSTHDSEQLQAIHHAMRMGKAQTAYNLMYDYVRDRLGVAV